MTRVKRSAGSSGSRLLELHGVHFHIGSNIRELTPFRDAIAAIADLGDFPVYDLGGGLGVPYLACEAAPSIENYVGRSSPRPTSCSARTSAC